VTITLQALSLVAPSSLHTTLEGPTEYICECKMDVKSTWIPTCIKWIMLHGHLDCFQKPPLGGRPNTKLGDHGTPNAYNRLFILFYHAWGPAWREIIEIAFGWAPWSHMTSHYNWGSMTTLHDFGGVLGQRLDIFLSSHNFMVITFCSCVKWP
jgi:hypothetical protein